MILKPICWALKAALVPTAVSSLSRLTTTLAPSTMMISSSLNPVAMTIRGGAEAALNLDRVNLRLGGLDSYAVLAAIVLKSVMEVYQSCQTSKLSQRQERIAQYVHAFSTVASVLSSLYVIMVFSLFNLYAKTAIGTGADHIYLKLLDATSSMRMLGFEAFVLSLVTFEFALVANVFLNFKGRARWLFSSLCALGKAWCLRDWNFVMHCASKHIFK
jgi:hypothetical protein